METVQSKYEAVIGLEVHAQLLTKSKIFCGCSTKFGASPNTQTCPVCLGLPGVLPVLNREGVNFAVMMAHATHCRIERLCRCARKNYFYPDLPKGYQISQYEQPLATGGYVEIDRDGGTKRIGLTRIHMDEGSFRCDANVSVRVTGVRRFRKKADVNDMKGLRLVEKTNEYEIKRQSD